MGLSPEVYASPFTIPQRPSRYYIHSGGKRNKHKVCLDTNEGLFLILGIKPK